jgi:hypothetical protein
MSTSYPFGQPVDVKVTFEDVGTKFDPSTSVTCKIQKPDGTETAYVYGFDAAVLRDALGKYRLRVVTVTTGAGTYGYRWIGDGTTKAVNEDTFVIRPTIFSAP